MAANDPIPEETRAEVLRLAREGVARNEIARQTGISTASVSRICQGEPDLFDRSRTAAATQARAVDLKAARISLASGLLTDVEVARGWLHTAEDARALSDAAKAVHYLTGSHVRLVSVDRHGDADVDAAKSMLGKLALAIGVMASEGDPEEAGDGEA
ncbi:helix-turn-helix domain-containing protein [Streptomyces fulvoviolaceus]|uniref:helix-turn-helix domain-containing protein n=1 Tax=Streptomyces fulvoviolaceus TaxID=285535 RepID=UPI0021C11EBF|nr:helix-turn-helix domain-containing protein [Streptomyces fulvoviolaceus]MCT9078778.1 helix-turn-helix domain-containing protein [Streptomyces fulvoviolaceus]